MKWIGQHIYDQLSRFRNDVYLENISSGTIASGGHLGLDSNNKIVKAVDGGGDLTGITAGTGLSGTDLTGPVPTLNVDAAQTGITSLGTLSSLAVTSASDLGSSAITLTNADVDQIALDINASNTTANVIDINAVTLTTGSAIRVQGNDQSDESVVLVSISDNETVSSPGTPRALIEADASKTGVVASTESRFIYGIRSTLSDAATNHANSAVSLTAFTGTVDSASTSGFNYNTGLDLTVTDATYNTGISLKVEDGGDDIKIMSSADNANYFNIQTTANGATTLTTVDNASANAHFEIAADGEITLDAVGSINLEAFDNKAVYIHADSNTTTEALNIDCNELTTGSAIKIDVDDALTASTTKSLIHVDYDKSGNTASAQSSLVTGLEISMDDAATGNAADSSTLLQGIKITCDAANADGGASQNGVQVILTDADTGAQSVGYMSQVEDGGVDFLAQSSADSGDYFSIATGAKGATTLTTVDDDGTDADLDFAIDGTFSVASTGIDIATNGTISNATWQGTAITKDYIAADQRNITGVGIIGVGTWQGTPIATAYIADDAVTEDKLANTLLAEIDANTAKVTNVSTNLSQTTSFDSLRIDSSDGTGVIIAEASGSIAGVMTVAHHDKLDGIEDAATADQSKSDINGLAITTVGTIDSGVWQGTAIAHAYIGNDAIDGDNIADDSVNSEHYVDGSIDTDHIGDAQITVAKLHGDAVQTAAEIASSFGDNDTSLLTAAAVDDRINTKHTYVYLHIHGRSNTGNVNWHFQDASADGEFNWETDGGADAFTDTTYTTVGSSTVSLDRAVGVMGMVIPYDCTLVGFKAIGRDLSGNDAFKAGLWSSPAYSSYGGNTSAQTYTLRAVAGSTYSGGGGVSFNGICKLDDLSQSYPLSAGQILLPSIAESDINRTYLSMTIVLKVPIIP